MSKVGIAVMLGLWAATLWPAEGDLSRGRELYEKRCGGYHGLDTAKVGPPLRNVFGHRSAADSSFPYSDGLKKARLVWDEGTLDRWLADPEALVADNDMGFRLGSAGERSAIIAYLKQLPGKQGQR